MKKKLMLENKGFSNSIILFRFMKITRFLFLIGMLNVCAFNAYSQNAKVTLNRTNTPLQVILNDIESRTNYLFIIINGQVDTQKKYLRMRKSAEEKQDDKIVAPMPGKVVKIPVRKGDRLETGDTMVVLEAMKMQSNYKVSSACVVKDILVSEGDSVDNNQVLMTLDLLKDDSYE